MADPRAIVLHDTGARVARLGNPDLASYPAIPVQAATLFTRLGTSATPIEQVAGGVEAADVLDELLQDLGLTTGDPLAADDDFDRRRPLAEVFPDLRAMIDELYAQIPTLGPLSLSPARGRVGAFLSVAILGATRASIITGTPPDGMTLNSAARTITGTPTVAGAFTLILREALANAFDSPKDTTLEFTVLPAIIAPRRWTADSITIRADGLDWTADGAISGGGQAFWSDPFWSDPFWSHGDFVRQSFWSDPFWTRDNFWEA